MSQNKDTQTDDGVLVPAGDDSVDSTHVGATEDTSIVDQIQFESTGADDQSIPEPNDPDDSESTFDDGLDNASDEDAPVITALFFESTPNDVKVNYPVTKPDLETPDNLGRLSAIMTTAGGLVHFINGQSNKKLSNTFDDEIWSMFLKAATGQTHPYTLNKTNPDGTPGVVGMLEAAVARPDSVWRQHVEHEGQVFAGGRPRIAKAESSGELLSGTKAIQKVTSLLSPLGQSLQIPLWHSGVWVTLKAPTLAAWVELDNRIALERITLGRATRGMVFSNDSVAINNHLIDFILDHVFDSTLADYDPDKLKLVIRQPDLQIAATYMAATIYTSGFPFSLVCSNDITECTHTTRELLQLTKTVWVDQTRLSSTQRKHMANRTAKKSMQDILDYQNHWPISSYASRKLNDSVTVVYGMPTLAEHFENGHAWIDSITQSTEEAFGATLVGNQRAAYLTRQAQATSVSLYSHWIRRIVIHEDENESIVEDRETLTELFAKLSSDDTIARSVEQGAIDYIDDTTMALVAIPNYACSNCGHHHLTPEGPMGHLLPLDGVSCFFQMLRQRTQMN